MYRVGFEREGIFQKGRVSPEREGTLVEQSTRVETDKGSSWKGSISWW